MIEEQKTKLIALFFALLAFYTIFSVHFEYALPYHIDSMEHIISAKEIIKQKSVSAFVGNDWEINYHLLFSVLLLVSGLTELQLGLIFPVFSGFLMGLLTFLIVRFLTKSNFAGLLSGAFTLAMASNMTILGPMFLVPMALSIAFLPAIFLFFLRGIESKKYALLLIVLLAFQTLVHLVYAIIALLVILVFLLLNSKVLLKNQLKVGIAIIVFLVLLPFFAQRLEIKSFAYSPQNMADILDAVSKKINWETLEEWNPKFFFNDFLGSILFSVSMFGLGITIAFFFGSIHKGFREFFAFLFENKNIAIFGFLFLVLLPLYVQFNLTDNVFLVPYTRLFMAMYYALLALSGIGLFAITVFWLKAISIVAEDKKIENVLNYLFFAFVCFLLLFEVSTQPVLFKESFYKNIEPEQLNSFFWLKERLSEKNIVLSSLWPASAIAALSNANLVARPEIRMRINPEERQALGIKEAEATEFFDTNCNRRIEILNDLTVDTVVSEKNIDCAGINRFFDSETGFIVYKQ